MGALCGSRAPLASARRPDSAGSWPVGDARPMISLALALLAAAPGDLPPCPGINPSIRRPRGSNCLGIRPDQCGADRVRRFLRRPATPAVRAQVRRLAGHAQIRWIRPGEPVIQDLRADRLNMELDRRGRIARVDCY